MKNKIIRIIIFVVLVVSVAYGIALYRTPSLVIDRSISRITNAAEKLGYDVDYGSDYEITITDYDDTLKFLRGHLPIQKDHIIDLGSSDSFEVATITLRKNGEFEAVIETDGNTEIFSGNLYKKWPDLF